MRRKIGGLKINSLLTRQKVVSVFIGIFIFLLPKGNNFAWAQNALPSFNDVEQIDFANGLFQRGFYPMAINEYKKFISLFPNSKYIDEAYWGVAESLFFLKRYKEGIREYKKYIELFPQKENAAIANLRIGQAFFFLQEYEKALQQFSKVDCSQLTKPFIQILYFYTGKVYRRLSNREEACEYFIKVVKVGGKEEYSLAAMDEMEDMFVQRKEYRKAEESYKAVYSCASNKKIKGIALYKQGEMQFLEGNYASAISTFREVLKNFPHQDFVYSAYQNLLLSLFNTHRYKELVSQYISHPEFVPEDERSFGVHYITVCAYSKLSQYEKCLSLLDKILLFKSLSREERNKALLKKMEVLVKLKHFKEALILTKKLNSLSKEEKGQFIFLKAEAFYGLGEFDEAYRLYKQVREDFSSTSFSDLALYALGYTKSSQGEKEEAKEFFMEYFHQGKDRDKREKALYNVILIETQLGLHQKAIEHSKIYLSTFKGSKWNQQVLFLLGSLYTDTRNYNKAIYIFTQLAGKSKKEKLRELYFFLGYNLQKIGRINDALGYYKKVLSSGGKDEYFYSSLRNLGVIYLSKGEKEKAAKMYAEVIKEGGGGGLSIDTYLWLVNYYLTNQHFSQALSILNKAKLAKEYPQRKREIIYWKAQTYQKLGSFEEAIKCYDMIISSPHRDVYSGSAHIGKGICLVKMGEFDKAKVELEKAIKENSQDYTITMRARFELANVERLKNNWEEAGKIYMLVAILYDDPDYCARALFNAGQIWEALNKEKEAFKAYKEIVEKYKQHPLYQEAKKRIEALNGY